MIAPSWTSDTSENFPRQLERKCGDGKAMHAQIEFAADVTLMISKEPKRVEGLLEVRTKTPADY